MNSRERNTNLAYKNVDRKMPAKGLVYIACGALLAGLVIPTYWVAARLNFHPELGNWAEGFPLNLYLPGQILYWAVRWGHLYPSIFLPALAVLFVGFVVFCAIIRHVVKRND
jgi:hypothetical protein